MPASNEVEFSFGKLCNNTVKLLCWVDKRASMETELEFDPAFGSVKPNLREVVDK